MQISSVLNKLWPPKLDSVAETWKKRKVVNTHVCVRKSNRNVFSRALVNAVESKPKFTTLDQSTVNPPLTLMLQTQSRSVQYLTCHDSSKLVMFQNRDRWEIARGSHVGLWKANINVFTRGLVNFSKSRPKFTIVDQNTFHFPLTSILLTRCKSVGYSTRYDLPNFFPGGKNV